MLIMDEVDGMSAGDRGGVGALNALIKKTKVGVFSFYSFVVMNVLRRGVGPDYMYCQ